jgi:hypothetical protein
MCWRWLQSQPVNVRPSNRKDRLVSIAIVAFVNFTAAMQAVPNLNPVFAYVRRQSDLQSHSTRKAERLNLMYSAQTMRAD